jgi:hypothetical protein
MLMNLNYPNLKAGVKQMIKKQGFSPKKKRSLTVLSGLKIKNQLNNKRNEKSYSIDLPGCIFIFGFRTGDPKGSESQG